MQPNPAKKQPIAIDPAAIAAPVEAEMGQVNAVIRQYLSSEVVLINQLAAHIINSGGKRMRPLLVVLVAKAFGHSSMDAAKLAAIIEFIHTATLLHDDVVDASALRRGEATANALFGNEASVLVGDFLYSRAFEMMVELKTPKIMEILAHTTNIIAEGEVMQLMNCNDPDTTEEQYMAVIYNKTAKLFEAACMLGALIAGQDETMQIALGRYGMHLGTAFQLQDDALDYDGDGKAMGKNVGDDLAEGKPTLPLIHAMRHGDAVTRSLIRSAIEHGGLEHIDAVMAAIESTQSIAYTARRAHDEAQKARQALEVMPESPYKQGLIDLSHYAIGRDH